MVNLQLKAGRQYTNSKLENEGDKKLDTIGTFVKSEQDRDLKT